MRTVPASGYPAGLPALTTPIVACPSRPHTNMDVTLLDGRAMDTGVQRHNIRPAGGSFGITRWLLSSGSALRSPGASSELTGEVAYANIQACMRSGSPGMWEKISKDCQPSTIRK